MKKLTTPPIVNNKLPADFIVDFRKVFRLEALYGKGAI